MNMPSGTNKTN